MVRTFQFECCKEVDGKFVPVPEKTPPVTAETVTEAMNHPDIVKWCNEKGYRIYKVVK